MGKDQRKEEEGKLRKRRNGGGGGGGGEKKIQDYVNNWTFFPPSLAGYFF